MSPYIMNRQFLARLRLVRPTSKSPLSLSQDVELIITNINVSYVEFIFRSFALLENWNQFYI